MQISWICLCRTCHLVFEVDRNKVVLPPKGIISSSWSILWSGGNRQSWHSNWATSIRHRLRSWDLAWMIRASGGLTNFYTLAVGEKEGRMSVQGGPSPRGPRFCLFLIEILLCLPHFAWAGGNRADHLVSNGGNKRAMALYTCGDKGNKSVTGFWQPLGPIQPPNGLRGPFWPQI